MTSRNIQKFLIFFFIATFLVILIIGVKRAHEQSIANQVTPVSSPVTTTTTTPSGNSQNSSSGSSGATSQTPTQTQTTPTQTAQNTSSQATQPTPTPKPQPTPTPTPQPAAKPKTASYTGSGYRTPWGAVIVSITVTDGKITNIATPQFPYSGPSQYARPYLIQQALAANSANIQGVSGATYTTLAFEHSLESALSQAGI